MAASLVWIAGCSKPAEAPPPAPAAAPAPGTPAAPPAHDMSAMTAPAAGSSLDMIAPDLPPLPPGLERAVRPLAVVKAAYEYAARHPEVLKYMPCFCGCERMGHEGNDDCFVEKRDANGRVTEWVAHGMICEVCIDVATEARQMQNGGASLSATRDAIERKYAQPGGRHTPTPAPPHKSGMPPH